MAHPLYRTWTNDDIRKLKDHWAKGLRIAAVAELMERTYKSVEWKAGELGLLVRGRDLPDRGIPTPEQCHRHAEACLREGGFPVAHVINGRAVWVWPSLQVAA